MTISKMVKTVALAVVLFGGLAAGANAAAVYPISAIGNSSFPGYPDADAIDTGPGSLTTDWSSFHGGTSATLILDLGSTISLANAYVTDRVTSGGGNGSFIGGVSDFSTSFSLTPCADAACTILGTPITVTGRSPGDHDTVDDFQTVVSLGGLTTRYLEYKVLAITPGSGGNSGLSDIHFTAVPEPTLWAMMLVGFFGAGAMLRSARRQELGRAATA